MALVPSRTLEHREIFRTGTSIILITLIILIYIVPPVLSLGAQATLALLACVLRFVGTGEDDAQWRTSAPRQTSLPVVSHLAVVF